MNRSTIYIITHKKFNIKYPNNYEPIQVGKKFTNLELPYKSDDTGINIADKNNSYCELTGIYWVLKNCQLSEYVGISHYRRYFRNSKFRKNLLSEEKILDLMKNYDVILPKKFYFSKSVWKNYFEAGAGKEKDLVNLKNIIEKDYSEYLDSFNYILNSYSASYCNMFVMSRENFIKYHNWLFEVLQKLENTIDISNYTKSEARIYGYLSEILLNVWVNKHNLKIKYLDMIKVDNKLKTNVRWKLRMLKGFIIGNIKEKFNV